MGRRHATSRHRDPLPLSRERFGGAPARLEELAAASRLLPRPTSRSVLPVRIVIQVNRHGISILGHLGFRFCYRLAEHALALVHNQVLPSSLMKENRLLVGAAALFGITGELMLLERW